MNPTSMHLFMHKCWVEESVGLWNKDGNAPPASTLLEMLSKVYVGIHTPTHIIQQKRKKD